MKPPVCKIPQCGRDCAKVRRAGFMLGYMDACDRHTPDMMRFRLAKGLPI
jgi:hypothetical protein